MKTIIHFLLFFPLAFFGQNMNMVDNNPYIEVIGSAEKEIAPNIITLRIVLQETNDKNKITIDEQERTLKEKLKAGGFDLKNLVIRNANASLLKLSRKTNDVINRKEYLAKVGNSVEAYKIFKILDEINVKEASIFETNHTDIQTFRKEVKQLALKVAKEKATDLLKSIDEQIDKPLIIREIDENESIQIKNTYSNVAVGYYQEETSANDYLDIKPIKLKYQMFARFKIK
ncbi:SIMPL domain-containing protein [Chryseobacterium sp. KACC 21268]|nr:SIMPL domain-containing protein [Chryseobacterium sp. KACC 21268]